MTASNAPADAIAAILEGQPPGKVMWLGVRGASMAPLLRGGETLRVVRCGPEGVRRGDLAILRDPRGFLVAHLVVSTRPLTTAGLLGENDAPGAVVLGRATAVRRGRRLFRLSALSRYPTWLLHRLVRAAWRSTLVRVARRPVARAAFSSATRTVRSRWVGPWTHRLLERGDLSALTLFVASFRVLPPYETDLLEGPVAGAFAHGEVLAVARVTRSGLLRDAYTRRWATALGIEDALVERLLSTGARVREAEVSTSQGSFLEALERRGFERTDERDGRVRLRARRNEG